VTLSATCPNPPLPPPAIENHRRAHAHVILENFLEPYLFNGQMTQPGARVVSLFVDQFPATVITDQPPADSSMAEAAIRAAKTSDRQDAACMVPSIAMVDSRYHNK